MQAVVQLWQLLETDEHYVILDQTRTYVVDDINGRNVQLVCCFGGDNEELILCSGKGWSYLIVAPQRGVRGIGNPDQNLRCLQTSAFEYSTATPDVHSTTFRRRLLAIFLVLRGSVCRTANPHSRLGRMTACCQYGHPGVTTPHQHSKQI